MKLSIFGIFEDFNIKENELNLINIKNRTLLKNTIQYFLFELEDKENNDIVILSDGKRLYEKDIVYINDIIEYSFSNKSIVDKIVKNYLECINSSVSSKIEEQRIYHDLINPLIMFLNELEVDYDINYDLDSSFYYKIVGIDFATAISKNIVEKIISIINIETKVFHKKLFIFSRALSILTNEEIKRLNEYVNKTNVPLIFIDCLNDSEINIKNNICVGSDYGVYKVYANNDFEVLDSCHC